MKRIVSMCLAMVLVLSLLPHVALATDSDSRSIVATERHMTENSAPTGIFYDLQPKEGHYQRWIDRLSDLPEYAHSFYVWLSENANARGALANPALAERNNSDFYHTVTVYTQTLRLPADADTYRQTAAQEVEGRAKSAFANITKRLTAVYDAFDRDHPEVFWLNGRAMYGYSRSYSVSYSAGIATVSYEVPVIFYLKSGDFDIRYENYRTTDAISAGIALREQTVSGILAQCPHTGTADQVRYLNKVLTERNAYNVAVALGNPAAAEEGSWECLSALVGSAGLGGPVCEGYSKAFMVLCSQLGIPCVLVDGSAKATVNEATEDHMWNYVKLDDHWYAVDVTWNDPFNSRKPLSKLSGYECEKWMLLGSDTVVAPELTFIQSHPEENRISNDGLKFTNGPLLNTTVYQPGQATSKIHVTVTNPGNSRTAMKLSLYVPGSKTPFAEKSLTGSQIDCTFDKLPADTYLLVLSKDGYASMDCTVSTKIATNKLPTLTLLGDICPDGLLNIGDVAKIYAHARGICSITDTYHLRVADLNGDGLVNIGDAARAYAKMHG